MKITSIMRTCWRNHKTIWCILTFTVYRMLMERGSKWRWMNAAQIMKSQSLHSNVTVRVMVANFTNLCFILEMLVAYLWITIIYLVHFYMWLEETIKNNDLCRHTEVSCKQGVRVGLMGNKCFLTKAPQYLFFPL